MSQEQLLNNHHTVRFKVSGIHSTPRQCETFSSQMLRLTTRSCTRRVPPHIWGFEIGWTNPTWRSPAQNFLQSRGTSRAATAQNHYANREHPRLGFGFGPALDQFSDRSLNAISDLTPRSKPSYLTSSCFAAMAHSLRSIFSPNFMLPLLGDIPNHTFQNLASQPLPWSPEL